MIESLTLVNTVTGQSVLIDRDNSDFVLEEPNLGAVQGTHHSYKYVDQIGVYIDNTTLEGRIVSISGWVVGDSYELLERNKSVLNRLVNPLHSVDVIVLGKYKLGFKPDYSVQYSTTYVENNEVLCKFLIQGTCADPTFSTVTKQTKYVASIIPKFRFPLIIPKDTGTLMGLREPSLLATIDNNGDTATGMIITFGAKTTVSNPSLLNVVTREYLKVNRTITPGEQIIISTESGSKYVKGIIRGEEQNFFKYLDLG